MPDTIPPTPETATITLNTPIPRESGPLETITLRKPKGGDLRGLGLQSLMQSDVNSIIAITPRIAQPFITEHEVANLEADDFAELAGAIFGFFMGARAKAQIDQMMGASPPTT